MRRRPVEILGVLAALVVVAFCLYMAFSSTSGNDQKQLRLTLLDACNGHLPVEAEAVDEDAGRWINVLCSDGSRRIVWP